MSARVSTDSEVPVTTPDGGGPTVLRRLLGLHLRRLREERGISRAEAAEVIRGSESKISRLELGRLSFRERDVGDLLTCFGVADPDTRETILTLVREANAPGWWRSFSDVLPTWFERYVGLESAASAIRTYEAQFIPGLLQTEEYARAVTRAGQLPGRTSGVFDIDRKVGLRAARQRILARADPPRVWAVIDEGALRRQIGGWRVMRAQLEHLLELHARPNVTIQIMPFGFGGHVAQVGAFTVLRFSDPDLADVIYLEHLTGAVYLDKREDADRYHEVFVQLAIDSQTPLNSAATLAGILSEA
jgi:transcriptional regulator with XRE-family HTH domain